MKWILIFLCLPAFGQLPVLPFAPSASSLPDPSSVPGLAVWWVSSDIAVGATVNTWVDRIQGKLWTNSAASAPTNSASGVFFDGSTKVLTNDGSFVFPNTELRTLWAVIKVVDNGSASVQRAFLSQPNFGAQAGRGIYWFNHTTTGITGSPNWFDSITNIIQDWILVTDATGTIPWYTNNVLTASGADLQSGGTLTLYSMGNNPGVSKGWFYLMELGMYTNQTQEVGTNSTYRTLLHNYAKTKYGVTP